jgi:ubiquinone/menaquinone biosynthesis C-methylase UbiE
MEYKNKLGTPQRYWINQNLDRYIKRLCPTSGAKILDLGCGDGIYSRAFEKADIKGSYLGIDLCDSESWRIIRASKPHGLSCEFRTLDAQRLQAMNRKFNFIIIVTALECMENPKNIMKAIAQVLEPNGRVLIIVTSRYALFFRNLEIFTPYTIATFKHLLPNTGLEIEEMTKVGGVFSFLFQTIWFGITFFVVRGLRLTIYLFFFGQKQKAKQHFSRPFHAISQIRNLHFKTKFGRVIQRGLYNILGRLDCLFPYCTSASLFVLRHQNS